MSDQTDEPDEESLLEDFSDLLENSEDNTSPDSFLKILTAQIAENQVAHDLKQRSDQIESLMIVQTDVSGFISVSPVLVSKSSPKTYARLSLSLHHTFFFSDCQVKTGLNRVACKPCVSSFVLIVSILQHHSICSFCEGDGDLVCCEGVCLRSFHASCLGFKKKKRRICLMCLLWLSQRLIEKARLNRRSVPKIFIGVVLIAFQIRFDFHFCASFIWIYFLVPLRHLSLPRCSVFWVSTLPSRLRFSLSCLLPTPSSSQCCSKNSKSFACELSEFSELIFHYAFCSQKATAALIMRVLVVVSHGVRRLKEHGFSVACAVTLLFTRTACRLAQLSYSRLFFSVPVTRPKYFVSFPPLSNSCLIWSSPPLQ